MHAHADQIIDLYRRHAVAWSTARGPDLIERDWLATFISHMRDAPKVLDIGCGSGVPIAPYLIRENCAYTGIDAAPELIDIARANCPSATFHIGDMRSLNMNETYDGLLAWHSLFHLTPDDQRRMFATFRNHAAPGAILMFTSGPEQGTRLGTFEGEPLYHASLAPDAYRALLHDHGFDVVHHVVSDPDCGGATIWVAQFTGKMSDSAGSSGS